MSTRSLIGTFNADGQFFRVRYCHNDGYPEHQVPALARALRVFDGDVDRLTNTILSNEWSAIHPASIDSTTDGDTTAHDDARRVGVFYIDADVDLDPWDGHLGEHPSLDYEWLYLFTDELLYVYANQAREGGWRERAVFSVENLPAIIL